MSLNVLFAPAKLGQSGWADVQCFLFGIARSAAHAWDERWWIRGVLWSAVIAQPLMVAAAIRAYYTLLRERGDRMKLLVGCSYGFALLLLMAAQIPCNSYVAGPIPRNQSAVQQRMWKSIEHCPITRISSAAAIPLILKPWKVRVRGSSLLQSLWTFGKRV